MKTRSLALLIAVFSAAGPARGQMGGLVSPGKLSRPHAMLEGLDNCQKCHEPGKQVTAARCLACHKPIAREMADGKGVHRKVRDGCVACHVEHAGLDGELRPFDTKRFDHKSETGFPLEGLHAPLSCAKCHRTRSFLGVSPACASCHEDVHKGRLGPDCARCHTPSTAFKATRQSFDHAKTAYPLTGAHRALACDKCHAPGAGYRIAKFSACADCHRDPHRAKLGACESCHTTETFRTKTIDHAKTGYPLIGRHASLECARCHLQSPIKVRLPFARCADCHRDVHRGVFKQDCASCHTETGFGKAPFDHAAKTRFPLEGRHAEIACAACHKGTTAGRGDQAVDFRGLRTDCASCHKDVHQGALGNACQSCHTTRSFRVPTYRHPSNPEFFAGSHAAVPCEKCHPRAAAAGAPRRFKEVPFNCASCHKDVHLGQLGGKCESCHSVAGAKFAPDLFNHAATQFPLTGKHRGLECAKCHRSETASFPTGAGTAVRLRGVPRDCQGCHRDPHLGQLGTSCATCHSTESFAVPKYVHARGDLRTFFTGRHAAADCAACHKKVEADFPSGHGTAVRYRPTPTDCGSCHKDPHRGALGARCESCHTTSQWGGASRAFHKVGVFPLDGKHLLVPCEACHIQGVIKGTPTRCYDCHWIRRQDDPYRTRLGNQCESCHRTISWSAVLWDHAARTGFPLSGAHRPLACESCHKGQAFTAATPECYSCHKKDYDRTSNPSHAAAGFPTTCETCHRVSDMTWQQATFNHAAVFPLLGVHAAQPCSACHHNNVFVGTPTDCYSCHQTQYQQANNPNHVAAGFFTTCQTCHRASDASWSQGTFNHTMFSLVGVHATQPCSACHLNNHFAGTPTDCYSCHQTQYQQASNPNHVAAGFPTTCDSCHKASDASWGQGTFSHTVFPLVGVHATQPCAACHANNHFAGTPTDCYSCHQTQYQQASNPNHVAAGFPTTCDSCHKATDTSWSLGTFSHTVFPLVGVHATQPCAACHANNHFAGTPTDCYSCHQTQYQQANNPNHVAAGFPTTCQTCHKATDTSWSQGTFSHTVFPLVGVHATQPCSACHPNNHFAGTPTDCFSCHQTQYQQANNPNHVAAGFPTTCQTCHKATDTSWNQGTFNHSMYPLVGVHATQPCSACHPNNHFAGTPTDCFSCHQTQYQQANNPNHIAAGFPTTCQLCHHASDTSWTQGVFNHSMYPLLGVHATQPCSACHPNNQFAGTPTDCFSCHQTQYQQANDPNHIAAGFPTTCQTCHQASDSSWSQGTFNHSFYPLLGVHATQPCSACHPNNQFAGTPTDCYSCHQTQYQQANNPNHIAAGFPTTCQMCHQASDASWTLGTFNHTWFPITSGPHAGNPCSACHTSPSDFSVFTCVTCHGHAETDSQHAGVPGYVYSSPACYSCHPQGQGGNAPILPRRPRRRGR